MPSDFVLLRFTTRTIFLKEEASGEGCEMAKKRKVMPGTTEASLLTNNEREGWMKGTQNGTLSFTFFLSTSLLPCMPACLPACLLPRVLAVNIRKALSNPLALKHDKRSGHPGCSLAQPFTPPRSGGEREGGGTGGVEGDGEEERGQGNTEEESWKQRKGGVGKKEDRGKREDKPLAVKMERKIQALMSASQHT